MFKRFLLISIITFFVGCSPQPLNTKPVEEAQKESNELFFPLAKNIFRSTTSDNKGVSWILQMCSEHADCSAILRAHESQPVDIAGWLYLTSNAKRCKCAPQFLAVPKPKVIRVHLCNSTCFPERGRRCMPHECFAGESIKSANAKVKKKDPTILKKLDRAADMALADLGPANGPLDLLISTCLECNLDKAARQIMADRVRAKFPYATFVDNPLNDSCIPGMLCEKHGNISVGGGVADLDGIDFDTIDSLNYGKKNLPAKMTLAWKICNNGLLKGEGFKDPTQRKNYCGFSRDGRDFKNWNTPGSLSVRSGLNPSDTAGCSKVNKSFDGSKKGFTWKLGDRRSYAVALLPKARQYKTVSIKKNGQAIDTGKYRGAYTEDGSGRLIYDFKKHSADLPDNVVLKADNQCWVLEKPQFRID